MPGPQLLLRPPASAGGRGEQDDSEPVGLAGGAMLPAYGLRHPHRPGRGVQRRAPGRVGCLLRQPEGRPRPHLLQSAARRPRVPQVPDEEDLLRVVYSKRDPKDGLDEQTPEFSSCTCGGVL